MKPFDIEQFKQDKGTRETEPGKYWNPRKKLLIKQGQPVGRPGVLPDPNKPRVAKAIMQKKAVLDRLGK